MEVSKLCFICFRGVPSNSNKIPNSGLGEKFAASIGQYLSLDDSPHGRQEMSTGEDDFGAVCSECEPRLEEFCEMHAQLRDLQKRLKAKVEEISGVMTKAEREIERKEEFEAYQKFLQLHQKRIGQRCVDFAGFRKDFLERVPNRNLIPQPYPVGSGSVSSGSASDAHEVVDANSLSQHSDSSRLLDSPTSEFAKVGNSSGIQTSSFSPSAAAPAVSNVAQRNEIVASKSQSLTHPSPSAMSKKSLLESSNSTARPPTPKRRSSRWTRISENQKQCVFCGKYCQYFKNLERHLYSHSKEKWYGCKICGNESSLRAHLVLHRRVHTGERLYKCELCEKRLASRQCLENHIRVHTLEHPFKCRFCKKEFKKRANCKTHEKNHERGLANS